MRFRPSLLFYALAVVSVILIPLTNQLSLDLNVHDTYFVLTYFHYLVAIGLMSLLTGLLYSWMSQLKKPIALKTAIFSFYTDCCRTYFFYKCIRAHCGIHFSRCTGYNGVRR